MIPDNALKLCDSILKEMQVLSDQCEMLLTMIELPRYLFLPTNATADLKGLRTL